MNTSFNPFLVLGVPTNCSKDEARLAFRRLAMLYHPDRVSASEIKSAEAKFKNIKAAWELIDADYLELIKSAEIKEVKKESPQYKQQWYQPEAAWSGFSETEEYKKWAQGSTRPTQPYSQKEFKNQNPQTKKFVEPKIVKAYQPWTKENTVKGKDKLILGEFISRVNIADAYAGFICEIEIDSILYQINVPKGIPHGLKFKMPLLNDEVIITTLFNQSIYQFLGVDEAVVESSIVNCVPARIYRTKDLFLNHEITLSKLQQGETVQILDFLGVPFNLIIPPNFDCLNYIKIPNRGYVDWCITQSSSINTRGDVYVKIIKTEVLDTTWNKTWIDL